MCCGLHGHKVLQSYLYSEMQRSYEEAKIEYERLRALYEDVVWYSTECAMRTWVHPWPTTYPMSNLVLFTREYGSKRACRPRLRVYYHGSALLAPVLPVEIVLSELRDAAKHMEELYLRRDDVYRYAPGGPGYEEVKRNWYSY